MYQRVCRIILLGMLLLALSGCSQQDIYEHAANYRENSMQAIKELSDQELSVGDVSLENMEKALDQSISSGAGFMSEKSKVVGVYMIIGSELIGIVLLIISSRSNAIKLKKAAIFVFILAIPLMTVIAIYGFAFLASWFN